MTSPTIVYLPDSERYINIANVTLVSTDPDHLWIFFQGSEDDGCAIAREADRAVLLRALRQFTVNSHEVKA